MMLPIQKRVGLSALLALGSALAVPVCAAPDRITVQVDKPGVAISPMFYGLMTEEINHSYDGGLYGELIQNRAFNDSADGPAHWSVVAAAPKAVHLALDTDHPANTALTHSARLDMTGAAAGTLVGLANEGYWGIPVSPRTTYTASFYARADGLHGPLTVSLETNDGSTVFAKATVLGVGSTWKHYVVKLKTNGGASNVQNRFVISATAPGQVWVTEASLFPPTYKGRANGNRIDLMQKLAGLSPAFLRMPGGNYLEGNTVAERFNWKNTIGPIEQRPGHQGPWGYRSTDGMGLLEFLNWCEDLKMQPLLAVYAGFSLNGELVPPGAQLEPYVQDALDEIEYVTGSTSTKWGAQRAKDGHVKPFPLTYVEVGNEDMFDRSGSYSKRFGQFYKAIKAKYPQLQIIATVRGTDQIPDVVDDHFYRSASSMERDATHYDSNDRKGPKIFVGEWASTEGSPTPTMQAALGDAAWLTGLERNSDVVVMEAYAPLLVNVNPAARQWGTNLIGYDAQSSYGSPSYYVQSMFGANRGDVVLPVAVRIDQDAAVPAPTPAGKIGVGTWETKAEFKDITVSHGDQILYHTDFSNGDADWSSQTRNWVVKDGALQQAGDEQNPQITAGDVKWTDYTYQLKARKISGGEGFLILFHCRDDANKLVWNVGGWGDTRTSLQRIVNGEYTEFGASTPTTVETGRWYDVKIEVQGRHIRCYLDGKLVDDAVDDATAGLAPVYSTASRDKKSGDVILKVVNVSDHPEPMVVDLQGAHRVADKAKAVELTGNPADVNSIAEPLKVAPVTSTLSGITPSFDHTFPAHSVTVLRINAK